MNKVKAAVMGLLVAAALVMSMVGGSAAQAYTREEVEDCPQGGATPSDPNYMFTKAWCLK